MSSLTRDEILGLVPHRGSMCLLDGVESWDATTIRARASSHRRADHPLRRDGRLATAHGAEYGAQASAVHEALVARTEGRTPRGGFLVALRDVRWTIPFLDEVDEPLVVEAVRRFADERGGAYDVRLLGGGAVVLTGRIVVAPPRAGS